MSENTPAPVAEVMAELFTWLVAHPGLPSFCYGHLLHNSYDDSWELTFRIPHTDNRQTLIGLAQWAVALGTLDIGVPRPEDAGFHQQLTASGPIGDSLRLTVWGHLTPGQAVS